MAIAVNKKVINICFCCKPNFHCVELLPVHVSTISFCRVDKCTYSLKNTLINKQLRDLIAKYFLLRQEGMEDLEKLTQEQKHRYPYA